MMPQGAITALSPFTSPARRDRVLRGVTVIGVTVPQRHTIPHADFVI